jgi:ubiquinone/menaquinone biosynthesis C-methylase UbiE
MIKTFLRRVIDYKYLKYRKGKILDLGCGDGSLMIGDCIGVDNDTKNIKKAKERGKKVFLGNAEKIKFNSKFDAITMIYLLHHSNKPEKILENAYKHLKIGGNLLIVESSKEGLYWGKHEFKHNIKKEWLNKQLKKLGLKIVKEFKHFGRTEGLNFSESYVTIAKKCFNE